LNIANPLKLQMNIYEKIDVAVNLFKYIHNRTLPSILIFNNETENAIRA